MNALVGIAFHWMSQSVPHSDCWTQRVLTVHRAAWALNEQQAAEDWLQNLRHWAAELMLGGNKVAFRWIWWSELKVCICNCRHCIPLDEPIGAALRLLDSEKVHIRQRSLGDQRATSCQGSAPESQASGCEAHARGQRDSISLDLVVKAEGQSMRMQALRSTG